MWLAKLLFGERILAVHVSKHIAELLMLQLLTESARKNCARLLQGEGGSKGQTAPRTPPRTD